MKIYIAGPYSKPDPVENTRNAILAAEKLIELGHVPYIPHLTLMWHLVSPHPINFWYAYDKTWLRYCNAVFRLPGESTGADNETQLAHHLGLPVYTQYDEIPKAKNE